jgi:hypothetical protein
MQRRTVSALLLLALTVLFFAAGCGAQSVEAQQTYYRWFQANKKPGAEADRLWGLQDVKVYGFNCPYNNFLGFGQANNPLEKTGSGPVQYRRTATCWLEGRGASGAAVKGQRDVTLVVTLPPAM